MAATWSFPTIVGLVLSGIVAGAALLMLLLGWLARVGDGKCGSGCMSTGAVLLVLALVLVLRLVLKA